MTVHLVHNRFAVTFDLQRRQLPWHRCSEFQWVQFSRLLCRHGSFGLFFLVLRVFHGLEQSPDNIFPARLCLLRECHPVFPPISPSVCPTVLLCCRTRLCASISEHCRGTTSLQEDRFLHHAVVLRPNTERRTNIIGTSPSYTAHVIVVQILLAIFSVSSGKRIFLQ